ncbi:MAG: nucleotidyl transferase AbiEii/AbiGii toxin family protein, partial [Porphyromonadaceae bacterium]|nr:nucleotidyl transferase AbiEii/AbiGii toxin family protein [Porphyromonadaceae bacterium]
MSFKAQIRNLAKKRNVKAQVLLQNYMFERFLERLSLSEYRDKFVLKGGMLVAAMVGMDARSTMDLDATLRGIPLTEESIHKALTAICNFPIEDKVTLTIGKTEPIRPDDAYGGYRVKITAVYDTIETPFSVDISTGDVITPQAVKYSFRGIFDEEKQFEIWAYNIETVMAEKIETILRRNILNTRPRDFYDIFILSSTQ